jgi:hypothetical protein
MRFNQRARSRGFTVLVAACLATVLGASVASSASDGVEGSSYSGQIVEALKGCNALPAPTINWGDGGPSTTASCSGFNHVNTRCVVCLSPLFLYDDPFPIGEGVSGSPNLGGAFSSV